MFIKIQNLTKKYGTGSNQITALKDLNLEIEKGEFVVILGTSGAGKTTLLNILGGMDRLTTGTFEIGDKSPGNYNNKKLTQFRRSSIGFVFQFYNLMPNLTALENVRLAQSVAGPEALDSEEVLRKVGLSHRLKNFPSQLSGGEQQRVAIARAIVKNPLLLLCDEPTGALDSKTGIKILELLKELNEKDNKTIIIVTHNQNIAKISKRVIHLSDGNIVKQEYNDNPLKISEVIW